MIKAEDTVLILLAAGRSVRFGEADKLTQPFLGEPLALHVVTALEGVPFRARIAVVSGTDLDFGARGYAEIANPAPEAGRGKSLALGVAAAMAQDPRAVLIALADMPRVTATHIFRMLDYASGDDAVLASSDGRAPRPPALFGRAHFDLLLAATGDRGAVDLIRRGHHVIAAGDELVDIDTREDLAALRARYGTVR